MDNRGFPVSDTPIPDEILEEYSEDFYRISFQSDRAGVVVKTPALVKKDALAEKYPDIVETWDAKEREKREDVHRIKQNVLTMVSSFYDPDPDKPYTEPPKSEVPCDQSLRPGMYKHGGEVRKCEAHPPNEPALQVCEECRASHYTQESRAFDRQLIMSRGARVPACEECAVKIVRGGFYYRDCVCDTKWTCYGCRENELEVLAAVRKNHSEGRCGQCPRAGDLGQLDDFCLYCRGWRVLAGRRGIQYEYMWIEQVSEGRCCRG